MLERRGALVDRKPDSQGQHTSFYVFLCLCVCLFVGVFELTRVDTYAEIAYVHVVARLVHSACS